MEEGGGEGWEIVKEIGEVLGEVWEGRGGSLSFRGREVVERGGR